ncbi:MAG: dihydroneopterin triphosphate diphosphatase [Woeseia sp.]|nr:dihydroneopterin triphosphate diphosphatase [Woeseia sp.]NNL54460.1 dihydroneopterin triphosphate diphosphatase [Woeseia sp.]
MRHRQPVSVLVLVYATCGNVLLLKRHKPFAFWQSVTGSLEADEDHENAARRELVEETGLTTEGELYFSGNRRVFDIDPRWRHRYAPSVTQNTEFEWRYRLDRSLAVQIDSREHLGYCWMPLAQAIDTAWSWTNKDALRDLRVEV